MAGKDKLVVLWSIHDHISTLAAELGSAKSPGSGGAKPLDTPSIQARGTFQGHEDTVEDVQFCPSRFLACHSEIYLLCLDNSNLHL